MYVFENPNQAANRVEDCTVRAFSILTGQDWQTVYWQLCVLGSQMWMMPDDKAVYRAFLLRNGYRATSLPDTCPDCYTVDDFCRDYPTGKYLLTTGSHAVPIIDGTVYDTFNSLDEVPVYVWQKEE